MKYSYKIHQDTYQDAWNWWDACNSINFGTDWSKRIDLNIATKIKGKNKKEAFDFLIPYLRQSYKDPKNIQGKLHVEEEMRENFSRACDKMVEVMGRPLYRDNFHFYLTTFPSIPYKKEKGFIWLCYTWANPTATFLHELCHLQFIHYWRENPNSAVNKLSPEQFENLKESLTLIVDENFFPMINEPDQGYQIHKNFRDKLKLLWRQEEDFEHLVKYAVDNISDLEKLN